MSKNTARNVRAIWVMTRSCGDDAAYLIEVTVARVRDDRASVANGTVVSQAAQASGNQTKIQVRAAIGRLLGYIHMPDLHDARRLAYSGRTRSRTPTVRCGVPSWPGLLHERGWNLVSHESFRVLTSAGAVSTRRSTRLMFHAPRGPNHVDGVQSLTNLGLVQDWSFSDPITRPNIQR